MSSERDQRLLDDARPEHDTEEMFKAWDDVAGKIVIFATRED